MYMNKDIETLIPNTTMRKLANAEGVAVCFEITPIEGYETHHCARCYEDENMETGEKTFVHGYSTAPCTVPLDYDFGNTKEVDGHIAYGDKEIFARTITEGSEQ
jgi:hypothetical protein